MRKAANRPQNVVTNVVSMKENARTNSKICKKGKVSSLQQDLSKNACKGVISSKDLMDLNPLLKVRKAMLHKFGYPPTICEPVRANRIAGRSGTGSSDLPNSNQKTT